MHSKQVHLGLKAYRQTLEKLHCGPNFLSQPVAPGTWGCRWSGGRRRFWAQTQPHPVPAGERLIAGKPRGRWRLFRRQCGPHIVAGCTRHHQGNQEQSQGQRPRRIVRVRSKTFPRGIRKVFPGIMSDGGRDGLQKELPMVYLWDFQWHRLNI